MWNRRQNIYLQITGNVKHNMTTKAISTNRFSVDNRSTGMMIQIGKLLEDLLCTADVTCVRNTNATG